MKKFLISFLMIGYITVTQAQTCTPSTKLMFYQDFENNGANLSEKKIAGTLDNYYTAGYIFGTTSRAIHNSYGEGDYGPVDASFASNVKLSFNFAPINIDVNGNSSYVTTSDDYLALYISLDGGATWSAEAFIYSETNNLTYGFNTILSKSIAYKGNNSPTLVRIDSYTKTNRLELSFSSGTNLSNLKISILGYNTKKNKDADERWIYDNIELKGDFVDTKTWDGSNWNGRVKGAPTSNDVAVINADFVSQNHGSFTACNCEISTGKTLTISSNTSVSIKNNIVNNGNIIVENDGNLIQVNDNATFTGNPIKVNRDTKLKRLEYNYWSSPVENQNLLSFSPNTASNRFYGYNESNDYFVGINPSLNNFIPAKGYAIRAPNNFPSGNTVFNGVFTGIPNNGVKTIEIYKNGAGNNLVGNPYPSNISFSLFYAANSSKIEPKAYIWTNTNPNPTNSQGSAYSGSNYAVRNLTDGIPAQNQSISEKPTDAIVVGQGFIVKKLNAGTENLIFNNSMRVTDKGKFSNSKIASVQEPKVWLQLITPAKNFNTILIGYVKGATNGIDNGYDATPLSDTSDMFYTVADNENLVIQGRSNNFNVEDKVQLGAVYYEPGNYEISIAQVEGIFTSAQDIYLKDNKLNKTVNLSEGSYQFYSEAGEENNRFEIVYKPDSVLGTDNISKNKETVVYKNTENIIVENNSNKITSVQVFDATGKLVASAKPNSNQFSIENSKFQKGLVIFKISLNGKTETKKFLVK